MLRDILKELIKEELSDKGDLAHGDKGMVMCPPSLANEFIGKVCMFRTYSAGVHFGILEAKNGQECLVSKSRRIWYWAKACSLSQLAMEADGDIAQCKIAMELPQIILDQVIEVIPMSVNATQILYGAPAWKK